LCRHLAPWPCLLSWASPRAGVDDESALFVFSFVAKRSRAMAWERFAHSNLSALGFNAR
jgi:hypothetical protein